MITDVSVKVARPGLKNEVAVFEVLLRVAVAGVEDFQYHRGA